MMRMLCWATLVLVTALWADPRQWADGGVPLMQAETILEVSSATNAEGYTLCVWAGSLGQQSVVIGQMIAPTGERLWDVNGRMLAQGNLRAGSPAVVSLDGGWAVGWLDAFLMEPLDHGERQATASIRVTKLDAAGEPLWPSGRAGVEVYAQRDWWTYRPFKLIPSAGGVFVTVGDTWETAGMSARRVDEAGVAWADSAEVTGSLLGCYYDVVPDGQGGLLVAWIRAYYGDSIVYANRLLPDGQLLWSDAGWRSMIVRPGEHAPVRITADGTGGMFVLDDLYQGFSGSDVRAFRFDALGEPLWDANGVVACVDGNAWSGNSCVTSVSGGMPDGVLILLGGDQKRVQKIGLDGSRLWGDCGVTVCNQPPATLNYLNVATDDAGGAIVTGGIEVYQNDVYQYHELRMTRLGSNGAAVWGEACVQVAHAVVDQYSGKAPYLQTGNNKARLLWHEAGDLLTFRAQTVDMWNGQLEQAEPLTVKASALRTVIGWNSEIQSVRLQDNRIAHVWGEQWVGEPTARFQIVDLTGQPLLATGGVPLAMTARDEPMPIRSFTTCEDGSGGFFAFFVRETDAGALVRCVHCTGAGELLTDAQGELVLYGSSLGSGLIVSLPDGDGGAFVGAALRDASELVVTQLMRVNASGEALWEDPAVVYPLLDAIGPLALVPGSDGACVLVLGEAISYPQNRITCQSVSRDGVLAWNTAVTDSALYVGERSAVCSDAAGGVYACWTQSPEGSRVQRIGAEGELLWGENALPIAGGVWYDGGMACAADALGNLTVAAVQEYWTNSDLVAQRFSPEGWLMWADGGMVICDAEGYQLKPQIAVVSDNELYIAWQNQAYESYWGAEAEVAVTHLNASGDITADSWWQPGGTSLVASAYPNIGAKLTADAQGGAVVTWLDQRTGFEYDHWSLYSQRLLDPLFTDAKPAPTLPTEFALLQNYPNPFNPETVIEFALPHAARTSLKVYDVLGREVATLIDAPMNAGVQRVKFNAGALASGVYFYRIEAGKFQSARKMVVMK
ncbi:MAG: T9SS type A sorting domain-containing protein [bacterium]|nr:T9SS type A sorting domain-containing protein [bacterium]